MFNQLYLYFYDLLLANDTSLNSILYMNTDLVGANGTNIIFKSWLACTFSIIVEVFILVLCCLFIFKIIKLFAKLFSGGTL